jgi:Plant transposon protein
MLCGRKQEASQNDVEWAFGVLIKKFLIKREVEHWFLGDIRRIVETSIILHNMMVEYRVYCGQQEDISLYYGTDNNEVNCAVDDINKELV